jgi:hypothetical protein
MSRLALTAMLCFALAGAASEGRAATSAKAKGKAPAKSRAAAKPSASSVPPANPTSGSGRISLTPAQAAYLGRVTRKDRGAWAAMHGLWHKSEDALKQAPHPAAKLQLAGLAARDPVRIASKKAAKDRDRVFALAMSYAIWGGKNHADKAREYLLAWARTNQPQGNPVDDSQLERMIYGYDLVRATFSPAEREQVDGWLRAMALKELAGPRAPRFDYVQSDRIKNVGLIGFLLEDSQLTGYAIEAFKVQLEHNLKSDGSTLDFYQHDSIHHQCRDLEPLLSFARVAKLNGVNLYDQRTTEHGSLEKSVAFVVPFVEGRKTHSEFAHTRSLADQKRGAAREEGFIPGHPFVPKDAARMLMLDSFFDVRMEKWVRKFYAKKRAGDFLSTESLLFAGEWSRR